jgi:hypothetical protein
MCTRTGPRSACAWHARRAPQSGGTRPEQSAAVTGLRIVATIPRARQEGPLLQPSPARGAVMRPAHQGHPPPRHTSRPLQRRLGPGGPKAPAPAGPGARRPQRAARGAVAGRARRPSAWGERGRRWPPRGSGGKNDPRISIEERYVGRDEYLARLAAAARELVSQRYLMERDVAWIVDAGARQWDYTTSSSSPDRGQ